MLCGLAVENQSDLLSRAGGGGFREEGVVQGEEAGLSQEASDERDANGECELVLCAATEGVRAEPRSVIALHGESVVAIENDGGVAAAGETREVGTCRPRSRAERFPQGAIDVLGEILTERLGATDLSTIFPGHTFTMLCLCRLKLGWNWVIIPLFSLMG